MQLALSLMSSGRYPRIVMDYKRGIERNREERGERGDNGKIENN